MAKRKKPVLHNFPPPKTTFMDLAEKGKVSHEDLGTHVDMWEEDPEATNLLNEYLGLNPGEYKKFLSDPAKNLTAILEKRKTKKTKVKSK